jgi:malonyl CoA-acyl carrier protein transacylase
MALACALEPTGMAAVIGGEPAEVLAAIEAAGLYPANRNGAGQIVAAGALANLEKFAADPPAKVKVVKLAVAGAFHTPFMAPAEQALATVAGGITPGAPLNVQNQAGPLLQIRENTVDPIGKVVETYQSQDCSGSAVLQVRSSGGLNLFVQELPA